VISCAGACVTCPRWRLLSNCHMRDERIQCAPKFGTAWKEMPPPVVSISCHVPWLNQQAHQDVIEVVQTIWVRDAVKGTPAGVERHSTSQDIHMDVALPPGCIDTKPTAATQGLWIGRLCSRWVVAFTVYSATICWKCRPCWQLEHAYVAALCISCWFLAAVLDKGSSSSVAFSVFLMRAAIQHHL
jgi:hypothetical protein